MQSHRAQSNIIMALPKGRIQEDALPILSKANIIPEPEFFEPKTRKLLFKTNCPDLSIAIVRSFDVATFVNSGICDIGICGKDVLDEFSYKNLIYLKDLKIGKCRLSVSALKCRANNQIKNGLLKIATKYTNITKRHYLNKTNYHNIEFIKLNGAIELAAVLEIADTIVDLVSTGKTLAENDLTELEVIANISSYLITNKHSVRSKKQHLSQIIQAILTNSN